MSKPIILLAIADYGREETLHLRGLIPELEAILKAFEKVADCAVVPIFDASIEKIMDGFSNSDGPIIGFHFAGHGNGYELCLKESVQGEGFAKFLGQQASLEWVFLNSCASAKHAQHLINEGIKAVITTSRAIQDEVAFGFAKAFYNRIVAFDTLKEAFDYYPTLHEMKTPSAGAIYRDRHPVSAMMYDPLWELQIREGAEEVKEWSLLKAIGNPLLGLPPIPPVYQLPSEPYRSLQWYKREHAELFFGRGEEILSLYKFANADSFQTPIKLLYGQTGVGKSSLLAAGLFPRLEESHQIYYLRLKQGISLSEMLSSTLELNSGESLAIAWNRKENELGKPLFIIIDQLEETITRSRKEEKEELAYFFNQLAEVFNRPSERPKGKLCLSFRKEYLSEIHQLAKQSELAFALQAVNPLGKRGIEEAILGINSTERLNQKYHLTIESGLASLIADQLLADAQSSIAPVLQVLLTKLWLYAVEVNPAQPEFNIAAYQKVKRDGVLLEDFVIEKFAAIRAWDNDSERSGLLLDLLMFHITELNTAEKRAIEDIRERYAHRKELLDPLLDEIRDAYLLIDSQSPEDQKNTSLRLIHDTLGPIIRKEYEQSQRDGQVAARILSSKASEISQNPNAVLDEHGLALLEKGKRGMRKWEEWEEELVEKSKRLVAQSKRIRKFFLWGTIIGVILILLTASTFLYNYYQNQLRDQFLLSQKWRTKADSIESTDPAQALAFLYRSDSLDPYDSPSTKTKIIQLNRDFIMHHDLFRSDNRIDCFTASENANLIAIGSNTRSRIYTFSPNGLRQAVDSLASPSQISTLHFIGDQYLLAFDNGINLSVRNLVSKETSQIRYISAILLKNNVLYYQTEKDSRIHKWDLDRNLKEVVKSVDFSLIDIQSWIRQHQHGDTSFQVKSLENFGLVIEDSNQNNLTLKPLLGHKSTLSNWAILPYQEQMFLLSLADGSDKIFIWPLRNLPIRELSVGPNALVRYLDTGWLLYDKGKFSIWDSLFSTQKWESNLPHEVYPEAISIDQQQAYLYFSDSDSLYKVDLTTGQKLWAQLSENRIEDLVQNNGYLWGISQTSNLLFVFDTATGKSVSVLKAHFGNMRLIVSLNQKNQVLTVASDSLCILWDVNSFEAFLEFKLPHTPEEAYYQESSDQIIFRINTQRFKWGQDQGLIAYPSSFPYNRMVPQIDSEVMGAYNYGNTVIDFFDKNSQHIYQYQVPSPIRKLAVGRDQFAVISKDNRLSLFYLATPLDFAEVGL